MVNNDAVSDIGQAIRDLRMDRGWSQQELSDRVGMHATMISKREKGRTAVSPVERRRFAKAFDLTLDEFDAAWRESSADRFLGGQSIPVINRAPAGLVVDYEEFGVDSEQGYEYLDRGQVDGETLFAVIVVGDSMQPSLYDRDYLVFSPISVPKLCAKIENGAIVFIRFAPEANRQGCTIARWFRDNGVVRLAKDNPRWPSLTILHEDILQLSVAIEIRTRRGLGLVSGCGVSSQLLRS